jgi:hypothetical protein
MWWDLGIMPLLLFYISNLFNYLHTGLVAQWSWQGKVYSFELSCVLSTWGSSCCGFSWTYSVHLPEFDPLCARLSPPRCLTCSWACRMSSGPWRIVVVRVSWPGHPTWIKKKKISSIIRNKLWFLDGSVHESSLPTKQPTFSINYITCIICKKKYSNKKNRD